MTRNNTTPLLLGASALACSSSPRRPAFPRVTARSQHIALEFNGDADEGFAPRSLLS